MDNDKNKTNTLPDAESHPTLLSKEAPQAESVAESVQAKVQTSTHLSTEANLEPTPDIPTSPENEEILVDISSIYQPTYTGATTNSIDETPSVPLPQPQQVVLPARQIAPEVKPITNVVEVPKEKIVYRDRKGGFISDLFWRLFNCVGCLLFLVGLLIISLAFWINF